jgi:hypothetical protein
MDDLRLRKLRTTQFILINSFILVALTTFTLFTTIFISNYSLAIFQRISGVVILVTAIMNMISKSLNFNLLGLFPSMRELMKYEKEKLGKEFFKIRWTQFSVQLFVALMLLFQSFFQHTPQNVTFSVQEYMLFIIPFLLILMIGINIGLVYHVKKIDKGTVETLKGYNKRSILIGLAIGIPMSILIIFVLILIIILTEP